ncbi:MAG: DUF711 family protein [Anaerolineales bacterium]|nr:DUF711 family protein [Anaerolineales bacterium]
MKIRSITYFVNPGWPLDEIALQKAGGFIKTARMGYTGAGYEVQTARMALPPFPYLLDNPGELPEMAQALENAIQSLGFDYGSLGPALPEYPQSYPAIVDALAATKNAFFSGALNSSVSGISLLACRQCAQVIQRAASISPDGFTNLRFAALANVAPGSPFFPAAYHDNGEASFAIATEAADLAVQAFSRAANLEEAQRNLATIIELKAQALVATAQELVERFGIRFGGIDFSLAPYPVEARSLGTAMERLGLPAVGLHGSLAAAALLTNAIDLARFPRTGFSGLMLPLLEDATLAQRAAEGALTVMDLLLYSAVCGTGLDTIPLPGDTSSDQIAAVLLDLAALAQRLGKPLTARLMPIPGKAAGEPTGFNFEYFANSRILPLRAAPLKDLFAGDGSFTLQKR